MIDDEGMISRGPPEWGSLIWQEPWADRGWKGKDEDWFMVVGLTFVTAVSGLVIAMSVFAGYHLIEYISIILLFLVLFSGLSAYLMNMRSRLPRRVYEVGITFYPSKFWWRNVTEEDNFVPFGSIVRITVERHKRWADRVVMNVELRDGSSVGGNLRLESYLPSYIEAIRDQDQDVQLEGLDYLYIQKAVDDGS